MPPEDNPLRASQVTQLRSNEERPVGRKPPKIHESLGPQAEFLVHLAWIFAALAGCCIMTGLFFTDSGSSLLRQLTGVLGILGFGLYMLHGIAFALLLAFALRTLSFRIRTVLAFLALIPVSLAVEDLQGGTEVYVFGVFFILFLYVSLGLFNFEVSAKVLGIVFSILAIPAFSVICLYLISGLFYVKVRSAMDSSNSSSKTFHEPVPFRTNPRWFIANLIATLLLIPTAVLLCFAIVFYCAMEYERFKYGELLI